ncbi:hypothetical protein M8J76_008295 [Diaphorina citri]|nr:hypothetical protein M8J76_008295 [Diaphorina citri]
MRSPMRIANNCAFSEPSECRGHITEPTGGIENSIPGTRNCILWSNSKYDYEFDFGLIYRSGIRSNAIKLYTDIQKKWAQKDLQ